MATWVTHLWIADRLLACFPQLHRKGFCVGNIAPDCNVENDDWTEFTPPRAVTHWMNGERKNLSDCDGFCNRYLQNRNILDISREEDAFLLGYYAHLLTDAAFQIMIRDPSRVLKVWERIDACDRLGKQAEGMERNWDSIKKLIPKKKRMQEIYSIEAAYLKRNPGSGYLTEILPLETFPDYLDYLPQGAIARKIRVMGYVPENTTKDEPISLSRQEHTDFVDKTVAFIFSRIQKVCAGTNAENRMYSRIASKEEICKGWSADRKFRVLIDGKDYLLRISPLRELAQRNRNFQRMLAFAEKGVSMCRPVEFGVCEDGVYSLQTWIDGIDAEKVIPFIDPEKQYGYGVEAGRILSKIHSVPAPSDATDWELRFNAKIDRKIRLYEECPLKYDHGDAFIRYISKNRHLLKARPQCCQHGDYHIGNMMIAQNGQLAVIDFEKEDHGDPWEEFNRIVWSAQAAPAFASGMVDGYFSGAVPMEFWRLLALYICSNTLGSLPWAIPFGEGEIQTMRNQAAQVLQWYESMNASVPCWYRTMV